MVPLVHSCRAKQGFWGPHSSPSHRSPRGSICLQSDLGTERGGSALEQAEGSTHTRLGSQPVTGSGRDLMGQKQSLDAVFDPLQMGSVPQK